MRVHFMMVYKTDFSSGVCYFVDEVRKLSWSGIPPPVRATTWQLLCVSGTLSLSFSPFPPPSLFLSFRSLSLSVCLSPCVFVFLK